MNFIIAFQDLVRCIKNLRKVKRMIAEARIHCQDDACENCPAHYFEEDMRMLDYLEEDAHPFKMFLKRSHIWPVKN